MCRIAGIIDATAHPAINEERVRQMCRLMEHGGPDDEGLYCGSETNIVLGNRRLALLDLSPAGHMPMIYGQRFVITYNGELYNHDSLRTELIHLGHQFRSHTDTEVILAAFAQWSSQAFVRLKGMFAFALWDVQEKELYLVRDPAGIKPLYYCLENEYMAFASEVRSFAAAEKPFKSHPAWPVMLMAYGHLPEPVTLFSSIQPLQKGCFLRFHPQSGKTELQSFSHYSFSNRITEAAKAKESIVVQLSAAVHSHMMADAPVGVFLSGGLDSSIIASLAAKKSTEAVQTLSLFFTDQAFSEKKYQDLVINTIKCKHSQHLLVKEEFLLSLPEVLSAMDLPSCDGINTWFISKYARRQGLKAVLSGIGGDELFGGYPSFNRMKIASALQHLPDWLIGVAEGSARKRLSRMAYLQLPGIKGIYLFLRGHFTPHEIARHLDMDEKQVWQQLNETPLCQDVSRLQNGNKASWMEFNLYMQNQLLRDADVMSMKNGVEIRVPFLDNEIIKLAFAMDEAVKFTGPLPKQFLINSFKDILPPEIYNRPKMGFSFPFDDWLKDSETVRDLLSNGNAHSKSSYNAFMKGDMRWYKLMALVNLKTKGI
jgi:asparagine synthase (glutamine-hydrolysing)